MTQQPDLSSTHAGTPASDAADDRDPRMVIIGPDGMAVSGGPSRRRRRRGRRGRGAPHHRAGRAAGQGDADRQHDPPAARGGEGRPARRGVPRPGSPGSTTRRSRSSRTASPPSWSRSSSGSRCRSPTTTPVRGRAADRPGPARRLARGAVPRHPDRDLRPADGRPGAARADAHGAPAGRRPGIAARHAQRRRPRARGRPQRYVPLSFLRPEPLRDPTIMIHS